MIILKHGVSIKLLDRRLLSSLGHIAQVCRQIEGEGYNVTVTSTNEGKHIKNSYHYQHKAIDVRSKDMKYPLYCALGIGKRLGEKYDVILESDHIHIEYDPK